VSGLFALHSITLFGYFLFLGLSPDILTNFRLGIASFVLEMVPFASILFSFTNTVGAALWAADLEKATK
jgi:hypothetical protein